MSFSVSLKTSLTLALWSEIHVFLDNLLVRMRLTRYQCTF